MDKKPINREKFFVRKPEKKSRTIWPWLERWLILGIESEDIDIRRRQSFTNIGAAVTALNALHHLIVNALYDFSALLPVNVYNLIMVIAAISLPLLHRFGENVAAITLAVMIAIGNFYVVTAFGLNADLQIYFTLAGSFLFLIGVQNWRTCIIVIGLMLAALMLAFQLGSDFGFVLPDDEVLKQRLAFQGYLNAFVINALLIAYALFALRRAEQQLQLEYDRSERLLTTILPAAIAERLKSGKERRIADHVDGATILFADLVGFTPAAKHMPPKEVVGFLDELFLSFDSLCAYHKVEKIKTIGDAYLAVTGLKEPSKEGAAAMGAFALDLIELMETVPKLGAERLRLRIGIHTGPVLAGVIGDSRMSYDIWGDSVNVAARLEQYGTPGQIQVSEQFTQETGDLFNFSELSQVSLKGVGEIQTAFLISRRNTIPDN